MEDQTPFDMTAITGVTSGFEYRFLGAEVDRTEISQFYVAVRNGKASASEVLFRSVSAFRICSRTACSVGG